MQDIGTAIFTRAYIIFASDEVFFCVFGSIPFSRKFAKNKLELKKR
jgi:hypothetical protein